MRLVRESVDRFYDYDLHVETRTIYLGDATEDEGVGPQMAAKLIKAMHILQSTGSGDIRILMNSFGGCWYSGMAIFDSIGASPCHITIEVLGPAMSMGAVILQAADERVIHPNATLMLHDGYTSATGTPKSFESWGDESKRLRRRMYEIFASRTAKSARYWEKVCTHDYFFDARKALAAGLVDRIHGQEQAA